MKADKSRYLEDPIPTTDYNEMLRILRQRTFNQVVEDYFNAKKGLYIFYECDPPEDLMDRINQLETEILDIIEKTKQKKKEEE